ncbi:MAG: TatD family hydrolase, partial [Rhizobiales bacterium]|nr:TatD family hydrolase [Hyphomicrobiales bacterium]
WSGATPWVLHSFDGSRDFAEEAIERGAFIGVGGLMTRAGSSELRSILADIPLDRLLLETDAPYLLPRGVKNRRNESSNIPLIAAALADLRGITIDEIAATTTANANRVFDLTCKASGG